MVGSRATLSPVERNAVVEVKAPRDPPPPPQNGGDQVIVNTSYAPPHQDHVQSSLFVGSAPQYQ